MSRTNDERKEPHAPELTYRETNLLGNVYWPWPRYRVISTDLRRYFKIKWGGGGKENKNTSIIDLPGDILHRPL